jgi:hypothetical protein
VSGYTVIRPAELGVLTPRRTHVQINRQNVKWAGRMAAILVLVAAAEVPIVLFTRKPLPWLAVIPGLIPILTAVFVIRPMMTAEKSARHDD